MKKFLVLYMLPLETINEMMKNTSPEDRKKSMDEWVAWMNEHKAMLVEIGAPCGKNKRVTLGGVLDTRNDVSGYSIIQAGSQDEAANMLAGNPHLKMKGAYIEVMECMPMGM